MAEVLERHPCLRVEVIANGVGLLRELRASVPPFTIPAASWLLLVPHADERKPTLYGDGSDACLLEAVFTAMTRHALHGLSSDAHSDEWLARLDVLASAKARLAAKMNTEPER